MFRIENGRKQFYQWDINQRLIVENDSVKEVHYSNAFANRALICEVFEENGARLVNVPNLLLQNDVMLKVYGFCGECVREEMIFHVESRKKPEDYVYTETEIKAYYILEDRIKRLEEISGANIDLNDYATKDYVNNAIGDIDIPETDLSDYYTKAETEAAIKKGMPVIDLTGYATESYVNDKIADIDFPETDLSNYYTKSETNSAISKAQPDLSPYAKKEDIPNLNGYATEKYVNDAIGAIPPTDLSNYYTKEQTEAKISAAKPDLTPYAKKTDIPSINGLATEDYVDTAISNIPETDLSGYYTKTEIDNKGYLTKHQDLSAYAKKTDIPSLNGYATETYVNDAIEAIPETDLSNYYTKAQTNTAINNAKPDLTPYATKTELEGLATETYVNNAIGAIPETDLSNYYTKAQTNTAINNAKPDLTPYALKANSETWVFTLKDGSTISKKVVLA